MKYTIFFLLVFPFFVSCLKNETRMINKADKRMAGTYEIISITTSVFDSTGAVDSSRTINNPGSIELKDVKSDEEVFNEIIFPASLHTQSWIFDYFYKNQSVYYHWNADPSQERVVFWTIAQGGYSYHITLNLEKDGDNYTWTYIRSNNATDPQSTTMGMKEVFKMKKQK